MPARPAWRAGAYRLARPILFRFDAERIHGLTLRALRTTAGSRPGRRLLRLAAGAGVPDSERSPAAEVMGLRFRNRIGLGAGFDKDAEALQGWAALGLGFAEVGTVTPLAQAGSRRPRLLRFEAHETLLNRMGFNNAGAAALARQVMFSRPALPAGFRVGVNIGRARDTEDDHAVDDYLACHRLVAPLADYLAVNVSSPNTPGLRALQAPAALLPILSALDAAGRRLGVPRPLVVKLSPDLEPAALEQVLRALVESPAAGVILSNTTTARDGSTAGLDEAGGLSGAPLLPRMLKAVATARALVGDRLAIIASGGIGSAEDARAALVAGADLVQLWTGLVFRGPGLIGEAVAAAATIGAHLARGAGRTRRSPGSRSS